MSTEYDRLRECLAASESARTELALLVADLRRELARREKWAQSWKAAARVNRLAFGTACRSLRRELDRKATEAKP